MWNNVKKSAYQPKWPIREELILVSVALSDQEYFYFPPRWVASPLQGYPSIKFGGTHLYTWVERERLWESSVLLKNAHNTMSLARAQTTAQPRVELTNHGGTVPPPSKKKSVEYPLNG